MALMAGERLGHYEIVSSIGAGATGVVYKARDTRLGRTVAIKVLPELLAENAAVRARIEKGPLPLDEAPLSGPVQ